MPFGDHALPVQLERRERAVALVQVQDAGTMPSASSARTPPTPSSSSWRMRMRSSPP
jgi:hypothetical protein